MSGLLMVVFLRAGGPLPAQTPHPDQEPAVPWRKLIRDVAADQKGIWSSPFHSSRRDLKPWLLFGSATAVLIATDKRTSRELPNTPDQVRYSKMASRPGAAYSLFPGAAAFFIGGAVRGDERMRETGFLSTEALANAVVVSTALKLVTLRERPTENSGDGRFWKGSGRFWTAGSSFPSGHSTHVWAMATVVAHEYRRSRLIPVIAYGLAGTVTASRFTARRHFASDAVAGAAIGWFIGNYVFHKRHRKELSETSVEPRSSP